ncbi:uncharacterized protein LOC125536174 isoform X1 [Triticum urartu]|nr:uncharacterized protein LOC119353724 isoform X1 [Triticum dicoccoides]XP_048555294.1 uncharacterized protein LOC125536174 isoform X1 [Triticum urartu]
MAFIVSKLARAALASRPVGDIAGVLPPCLPRLYLPAGTSRRMFAAAGGPKPKEAPRIYPLVDENSIKSKESLWALYECWCKYWRVSRDREEMVRRFKSFEAAALWVYKMNNSGCSQVSQLGPYSDMSQREIAELLPPLPEYDDEDIEDTFLSTVPGEDLGAQELEQPLNN